MKNKITVFEREGALYVAYIDIEIEEGNMAASEKFIAYLQNHTKNFGVTISGVQREKGGEKLKGIEILITPSFPPSIRKRA